MWSEPKSQSGAAFLQRFSKNVAKAKMMIRMRAKPPIMTWVFVKWKYMAFSIALNVRNGKRDIAVAAGYLQGL